MRYLLLGALLGLLLVFPPLLAVVAAVASQPVAVAFALGVAAGLHARRRWAR